MNFDKINVILMQIIWIEFDHWYYCIGGVEEVFVPFDHSTISCENWEEYSGQKHCYKGEKIKFEWNNIPWLQYHI